MKGVDKVTGQVIDYKSGRDNAPPSYSSPNAMYKDTLKYYSDNDCFKCCGTGYIGSFKHISGGRCFRCLSDERWNDLLGVLVADGLNGKNEIMCQIRHITCDEYERSGFIVTKTELPPIGRFETFDTYEEACARAEEVYDLS